MSFMEHYLLDIGFKTLFFEAINAFRFKLKGVLVLYPSVKNEWKQKVKSDLANVVSSIENNNSKAAAKKAA